MYLLLIPYIAISCAYCIDAWRASRLSRILKPLLMPSLLMGYCFAARPVQPLIAIGIALGFVGDVALMLHGDWAFIAGLAGFLLGHVMYSIWFIIQTGGAFSPWSLFYIPLAIAAGVMLFGHLRPGLKQMKLPALCYDIVCAAAGAAVRWQRAYMDRQSQFHRIGQHTGRGDIPE